MLKSSRNITRLIFLIALMLIFEMIGLPQPITGPIVNMMLLLTTLIISPLAGCILGLVTPVVAGLRGQLPPLLLPMIPFIVLSNASLIFVFFLSRRFWATWLKDENVLLSVPAWIGLFSGAIVKFIILYHAVRFFLPFYLGKAIPDAIIAAMSLPQLITAIVGGLFAFLIYRMLQSRSFV
jgi:hypothetical protein